MSHPPKTVKLFFPSWRPKLAGGATDGLFFSFGGPKSWLVSSTMGNIFAPNLYQKVERRPANVLAHANRGDRAVRRRILGGLAPFYMLSSDSVRKNRPLQEYHGVIVLLHLHCGK